MKNKKILFGISASFCNHHHVLTEISKLNQNNFIQIVLTYNTATCSTRYGICDEFIEKLEQLSGNKVIQDIIEAEKIGPQNLFDIMIIAPLSANSCSRLYYGAYDCPVALAAKAMIRNGKNIVIAPASNDFLGISAKNLFGLLATKNYFCVPFSQDDAINKPNSIVAHWDLIEESADCAYSGRQLQPLLREKTREL